MNAQENTTVVAEVFPSIKWARGRSGEKRLEYDLTPISR